MERSGVKPWEAMMKRTEEDQILVEMEVAHAKGGLNRQDALDAVREMRGLVKEERRKHEAPLAEAVLAFAEWHWGGYEEPRTPARDEIGRHLWGAVSDLIYAVTGDRPPGPPEGPRADPQVLRVSRSGRTQGAG